MDDEDYFEYTRAILKVLVLKSYISNFLPASTIILKGVNYVTKADTNSPLDMESSL